MSILKVNTIQDRGGNTIISSDGSGNLTQSFASNTPYFKATLTSDQSISATTWTVLNLNNEIYDSGGYYDTSTYRFTPPEGKYFLTGSAGNNASITYLYVSIYKNGNQYANLNVNGSNAPTMNVNVFAEANGTDYFDLRVFVNTTTSIMNPTYRTYFSGHKLIGV